MGLLDLLRRNKDQRKEDIKVTRSALEEARDPSAEDDSAVTKLIEKILRSGIDGVGPFSSATKVGDAARQSEGDTEKAIDSVIGKHVRGGAAGGFATSLGGFITMPVAIPVNVFEFYVQATRMVGAIAHLRGYDVTQDDIRTAVLLTLVGSDSNEVLEKAGVPVGAVSGGHITALAMKRLPKSALMVVNKAVGFRVLKSVGAKGLSRFGRMVPVLGGGMGAALDGFLMKRIGDAAKREFPQL